MTDRTANTIARHDYLPFGEEIPASTVGRNTQFGPQADTLTQKFTGKERDAESGLDYFGARYYGAALGRFPSPDPGNAGADLTNPQSWNGYAYVGNNPLNSVDPSGACDVFAAGITMYPGEYPTVDGFAKNKIAVFPYAGSDSISGLVQAATDGGDAPGLVMAIRAAISQSQPSELVNLFTISGGAQTASLALGQLSSEELARIGNITYMIPGSNPLGGNLPTGSATATYVNGGGNDQIIPSARPPAGTYNRMQSSCGHDPACIIRANMQLLKNLSGSSCSSPGIITPTGIVAKGTAKSTIYFGNAGGGSSPGNAGGGYIFQATYGEEGNFIGGSWNWIPGPSHSPNRVN